jgi:hypothetical protein
MTGVDFQSLNLEKFKEFCKSLSISDINTQVKQMTPEQLTFLVQSFTDESPSSAKKKIIAAVAALDDRTHLELVGQSVTAEQFFMLLEGKSQIDHSAFHKIPPLLVGMSFNVFTDVLLDIPKDLLIILQEEGSTEPLQHQLTLFCHELIKELEYLSNNLIQLENQLDGFDTRNINHDKMLSTHQDIKKWEVFANKNIIRIRNALAIAWNTNRTDLIDTLSFQNESWLKYDTLVIGRQREYNKPASGLYARFESRLNTIFSNPEDPSDIEALHDNEPAVEALVKFSLWYLHDYWEIGLLPHIGDVSQLDLDSTNHTDRERADYRAELFQEAQKNLEKLGLKTVSDLKNKEIYSKEMLEEYLSNLSLDTL